MDQFERVLQRAVEKLYEDEVLRSNLDDEEATTVLGWAEEWLTWQIAMAADDAEAWEISDREFPRVRQVVRLLNELAESDSISLARAITELEPALQTRTMTRAETMRALVEMAGILWRIKDESATKHE